MSKVLPQGRLFAPKGRAFGAFSNLAAGDATVGSRPIAGVSRVNDLLLEGAEHVLALNGRKMRLRK
jgi:hypothetical protein